MTGVGLKCYASIGVKAEAGSPGYTLKPKFAPSSTAGYHSIGGLNYAIQLSSEMDQYLSAKYLIIICFLNRDVALHGANSREKPSMSGKSMDNQYF